ENAPLGGRTPWWRTPSNACSTRSVRSISSIIPASDSRLKSGWLQEWLPSRCPSSSMRRTSCGWRSALLPIRKNVARTWCCRSRSSRAGVYCGSGPPSKLRYSSRAPPGGMAVSTTAAGRQRSNRMRFNQPIMATIRCCRHPNPTHRISSFGTKPGDFRMSAVLRAAARGLRRRPTHPRLRSAERRVLQGYGLIYFGNDWYAENRTSSHHVAERLAHAAPLLYVDSPGMRAPQASGRDLRRAWRKLRAALRAPVPVRPNLWHCTVPQLPFRRVPGVDWLNRVFGRWAVRRAMRVLGDVTPISWFAVPHPGFLAQQLGERLCVYYCIDDYAAHPG